MKSYWILSGAAVVALMGISVAAVLGYLPREWISVGLVVVGPLAAIVLVGLLAVSAKLAAVVWRRVQVRRLAPAIVAGDAQKALALAASVVDAGPGELAKVPALVDLLSTPGPHRGVCLRHVVRSPYSDAVAAALGSHLEGWDQDDLIFVMRYIRRDPVRVRELGPKLVDQASTPVLRHELLDYLLDAAPMDPEAKWVAVLGRFASDIESARSTGSVSPKYDRYLMALGTK